MGYNSSQSVINVKKLQTPQKMTIFLRFPIVLSRDCGTIYTTNKCYGKGRVGMKKEKYFQLSQTAVEKLAAEFGTPLLVLSLKEVKKSYNVLRKYLPRVKVHYAIKANPHPEILRVMAELGSCFDVASDGEIHTLHDMGVAGSRMIYANPVKLGVGLEACR